MLASVSFNKSVFACFCFVFFSFLKAVACIFKKIRIIKLGNFFYFDIRSFAIVSQLWGAVSCVPLSFSHSFFFLVFQFRKLLLTSLHIYWFFPQPCKVYQWANEEHYLYLLPRIFIYRISIWILMCLFCCCSLKMFHLFTLYERCSPFLLGPLTY